MAERVLGWGMSDGHNFEFVTVTLELEGTSTISMTPETDDDGIAYLAVAMQQMERAKVALGRARMTEVARALDMFLAAGRIPRLTSTPVFLVGGERPWVMRFYVETIERDGIWLACASERHLVTVHDYNLAEIDGLLADVQR